MDISTMPKGTLFRLAHPTSDYHTYIVTSDKFYCHIHNIHKINVRNIDTGEEHAFGSICLWEDAIPLTDKK